MASWHFRAVPLPGGGAPESFWVSDGRLTRTPIPGAETLPGAFVLPGLVDAHVHLGMDMKRQTGLREGSRELVEANLAILRSRGVLAVRDAGAVRGMEPAWLRSEAPVVIGSGRFLATAGHYHEWLYDPIEAGDLVSAGREQIEHGLTWIKIIADFPGADGNWFAPRTVFPIERVRDLIQVAHAAGARVMAHTSGPLVHELVAAGVDSIEHGNLVDESLVREMARRGTAWTPTLATVIPPTEQLAQAPSPEGPLARRVMDTTARCLPLAVELGVPVLAGSDELPHGEVVREVEMLRRFGLTGEQALAAATTVARRYLGLRALEEGAPADLVLLDADPREDLGRLARPAVVLCRGERVGS